MPQSLARAVARCGTSNQPAVLSGAVFGVELLVRDSLLHNFRGLARCLLKARIMRSY